MHTDEKKGTGEKMGGGKARCPEGILPTVGGEDGSRTESGSGAKPAHGKKLSKCAQGGLGCRDCQGSRVIEDQGTSVGWESCPAAPSRVDGVMGECAEGAEAVSYLSHLPAQQPAESL